jgi:hypothetical protein
MCEQRVERRGLKMPALACLLENNSFLFYCLADFFQRGSGAALTLYYLPSFLLPA